MAKAPTMKDVAKAAGVSVMTVSRAFRQDASISEATKLRIQKTSEDLGYIFDSTASNLKSQKSGFVAVVIPSLNNANFAATVGALSEGLKAEGLQVLLGYSNYDVLGEEKLIEQLLQRRPEAIVVTGGQHTDRGRRLLQKAGIPVVETWDIPENPVDHVVGFSNAKTMEMMVDHLVSQGKTRLGFIGGDTALDTRGVARRRGFLSALALRGLEAHRLIGTGPPPVDMARGAAAMQELLRVFPDSQAVVCVSDLSAFGAICFCQRQGVSVPSDMCIAGFGAYDISAVAVPTITTIDPFSAEIGRRAAAVVVEAVRVTQGFSVPKRIEIQPVLRIGESTQQS